jgi:HAD superfamily hydrolase (TIGR01490 family)
VLALRQHQSEGRPALLVSGTFQGLLDVIVQRLGLQGAAGTRLQVRSGRYTGGVIEPICFAGGKVTRVQQVLAHHPGVDLASSYAYGDSIHDLPLLEAVAHPAVVCPDDRLAHVARQRGWPFVGGAESET